jgi:FlaA1/EpsC-like NDP-sugar epimerase/EAL domain-containing protein (putative c-di-GMP-specific phosphodiesterase class I)
MYKHTRVRNRVGSWLKWLSQTWIKFKQQGFWLIDLLILFGMPFFAVMLRSDSFNEMNRWMHFGLLIAILLLGTIKVIVLWGGGFYRRYWRYAGTDELMLIAGLGLASAILSMISLNILYGLVALPIVPRSLPILDSILSFVCLGLVRFSIRFTTSTRQRWQVQHSGERLIIYGAGAAGIALVEDMQRHPNLGMNPVALVDDDPAKVGLVVRGVPIVGDRTKLEICATEFNSQCVVLAMPSTSGKVLRAVVECCRQQGLKTKTLPGRAEIVSGRVNLNSVREVKIEDLLRREPIKTDIQDVVHLLKDKNVLITGAGGSIGSELCRQILSCAPKQIVMLGHGENSVFQIQQELLQVMQQVKQDRGIAPATELCPVIADLQFYGRIESVFAHFRPEIVFHAAAHKHVPMMEQNPCEAIINNVQGTQNLLNCALRHGVTHFVMISTDKAVQPTSIMGASKRIAELLVLQSACKHSRCFSVVRFGNVLGSRGSVVPTFKQQIAMGGPVTITHPDMTRYFMTIPEAVQLVLQASVISQGGEIFMLNMGEPVKILDLARDLIRLSGYEVGVDIDIEFTGLRPGEKLYEELLIPGEVYDSTKHEKLMVVRNARERIPVDFEKVLPHLYDAALNHRNAFVKLWLKRLIPEYAVQEHLPDPETFSPLVQIAPTESQTAEKILQELQHNKQVNPLKQAIKDGSFTLLYQPIVLLEKEHILSGFEALVRWQHPQHGFLLPSVFLTMANQFDLLTDIEWWVMRTLCQQVYVWQQQFSGSQALTISVNVSSTFLNQWDLIPKLSSMLRSTHVQVSGLRLEIPEEWILKQPKRAMSTLLSLKALGFQLQLDHFGRAKISEFSPLVECLSLFVSLKIDPAQVQKIGLKFPDLTFFKTTREIAEAFNLDLIATGVETVQQVTRLKALNCKYGQGFFFLRPIGAEDVPSLVSPQTLEPIMSLELQ